MKKVLGWVSENWVLISVIIPSLITGLTSQKSNSKVMKVVKKILEALSVLTHKDMPGTFKAPIKVSKDKEDK